MSKKKTHEEYVRELAEVNPDIEVIGIYCGANIKIPHRCKKDGYVWDIKPSNALHGYGCPACGGYLKKTHEQYVAELAIKNPTVEVVEKYQTINTKIMHHCLIHDVYWKIMPSGALNGNGCEECRKEKFHKSYAKTHEQYIEELFEINPNIEVVGQYVDAKTKITHHCLIHDSYFESTPDNSLNKKCGCQQCTNEKRRESMKISHEEYIQRVKEISPHIDVIGKYINMKTKTIHRCNIHDIEWDASPERILEGFGCKECGKEKYHQSRAKTTKEYIEEVKNANPDIEVLGEYISNKTPILHRCKKHNIMWNAIPNGILQGCGCWKCRNEKISVKAHKTHEEYVSELKDINHNISVIGKYIDANTPILHECLECGHEWHARPANILFGTGCPRCANRIKRTTESYINELSKINPYIEPLEQYISANTPILHLCKKHNVKWNKSPSDVLRGGGCKKCKSEKISIANKKTNEQYIEELKSLNKNIISLEDYIDVYTHIKHKCLICNYEWDARPTYILSYPECPHCNKKYGISRGEVKICKWLEKNNIIYEQQKKFNDCRDINPLPFDFYLPTFNIAIEYQGMQHYEPIDYFGGEEKFQIQQKHDMIKEKYCNNNGILLLCIPYYKYDDIEEELNNFLFI